MSQADLMKKASEVTVPLDELKLDLSNIRFQHHNKSFTDKEMEVLILKEGDTQNLYEQIKMEGGLYEALFIDENNVVVEGNRRLVCLRGLKKEANESRLLPTISPGHFDNIRCWRFPNTIDLKQRGIWLASIHVSGKKTWKTLNRARQIYNLRKLGLPYEEISKAIGMGKGTVIRMADVYEVTDAYGKKYGNEDTEWYHKYTYFDELFKRKELKEFRQDEKNVQRFGGWVRHKKFKDVRDVRLLNEILDDSKMLEKFERTDFRTVLPLLSAGNPALYSPTFKQIKKTMDSLHKLSRKEFVEISKDPVRIEMLKSLRSEIAQMLKDMQTKDNKK